MAEPTPEEFDVYERVKNYLEGQADKRLYGYLLPTDSVYSAGDLTVVIGGRRGPLDDPKAKYEEGYYQAMSKLVEYATDSIEAHWTVYPILFVSRHALELTLKNLIVEVFGVVPDEVGGQHNIKTLWEILLKRLEAEYAYAVPRHAELITKVMSQLTEIDPKSMASRYATTKDFRTVSITTSRRISLRNLEAIVSKLYNELFNILHTVEEHRQYSARGD